MAAYRAEDDGWPTFSVEECVGGPYYISASGQFWSMAAWGEVCTGIGKRSHDLDCSRGRWVGVDLADGVFGVC